MIEELYTLHKTDTKDLVPLPLDKSIISSRCVYKIKIKSHGSIEQYKSQLVVKVLNSMLWIMRRLLLLL